MADMIGAEEAIDVLQYLIQKGMINLEHAKACMDMQKRKEYLDEHQYKVWQSNDGKWYTYLPNEEKGRVLKKRTTKRAIEDVIVEHYREEKKRIYFRDCFLEWMQERRIYGEITMSSYARYHTDFERFFPPEQSFCKIQMADITAKDLEYFIKSTIVDMQLSEKAYSGLRGLLIGTFKYAKRKGYTKLSISAFFDDLQLMGRIFQRKEKDPKMEVFTGAEAEKLAEYFRSVPTAYNLGLLLQLQTGLRVGELAALKQQDITEKAILVKRTEENYRDPDSGIRIVRVKEEGKTESAIRQVILPEKAKETVRAILLWHSGGEYLFEKNGERISCRMFNYYLKKACNVLKITPRSTHKIRKTYGSALLIHGVDESLVKEMMGHKNISTTKNYYYHNIQDYPERYAQVSAAIKY